jgi:hypothetical protein
MTRQPVPYDQHLAGNLTELVGEKLEDLRAADHTWKQMEVNVSPRQRPRSPTKSMVRFFKFLPDQQKQTFLEQTAGKAS